MSEPAVPVCRGCEAHIHSVTRPGSSWLITTTAPDGTVGTPQPFCLTCMSRLFALGVSPDVHVASVRARCLARAAEVGGGMTPAQLREVLSRSFSYADGVLSAAAAFSHDVMDRHDIERAFQAGFLAGFEAGKVAGHNAARGVGRK